MGIEVTPIITLLRVLLSWGISLFHLPILPQVPVLRRHFHPYLRTILVLLHLVEMIETTHLNSNADDNPPSQKVKQTPTSTLKPTVLTELSEKQTQATKKTTLHLASKIKRKTYQLSTD